MYSLVGPIGRLNKDIPIAIVIYEFKGFGKIIYFAIYLGHLLLSTNSFDKGRASFVTDT